MEAVSLVYNDQRNGSVCVTKNKSELHVHIIFSHTPLYMYDALLWFVHICMRCIVILLTHFVHYT